MKNSTIVILVALGFAAALGILETWALYGRGSDKWIEDDIKGVIAENLPEGNSPVAVEVESHRVKLEGDFPADTREKLERELSDIPGVYRLTSRLTSLNEPAVEALTASFNSAPINIPVTHQLEKPGKVILSGRVDDPELRARLVETYDAIGGVQTVVERWTEDVAEKIEADIREILKVHNIYFDHNMSTIRSESWRAIESIAEVLKKYPDQSVRIEGHTDSVDTEEYNQRLSENRSAAVREALGAEGIALDRLSVVGYGETRPIANNAHVEGRAENRRTEFRVVESEE